MTAIWSCTTAPPALFGPAAHSVDDSHSGGPGTRPTGFLPDFGKDYAGGAPVGKPPVPGFARCLDKLLIGPQTRLRKSIAHLVDAKKCPCIPSLEIRSPAFLPSSLL